MQLNENNQPLPYEITFCEITLLHKFRSAQSPSLMILSEDTDSTETLQKVLSLGFILN